MAATDIANLQKELKNMHKLEILSYIKRFNYSIFSWKIDKTTPKIKRPNSFLQNIDNKLDIVRYNGGKFNLNL